MPCVRARAHARVCVCVCVCVLACVRVCDGVHFDPSLFVCGASFHNIWIRMQNPYPQLTQHPRAPKITGNTK